MKISTEITSVVKYVGEYKAVVTLAIWKWKLKYG